MKEPTLVPMTKQSFGDKVVPGIKTGAEVVNAAHTLFKLGQGLVRFIPAVV